MHSTHRSGMTFIVNKQKNNGEQFCCFIHSCLVNNVWCIYTKWLSIDDDDDKVCHSFKSNYHHPITSTSQCMYLCGSWMLVDVKSRDTCVYYHEWWMMNRENKQEEKERERESVWEREGYSLLWQRSTPWIQERRRRNEWPPVAICDISNTATIRPNNSFSFHFSSSYALV